MARSSKGRGRSLNTLAEKVGRYHGMSESQIDVLERDLCTPMDRLDVWSMSMSEVAECAGRRLCYMPHYGDHRHYRDRYVNDAARLCMGDEQRSATTVEQADRLVEAALTADPRLARRSKWHRGDEGELACPALVAAGDDAPYFFRRRGNVSEANGGEPIRLVISTDSNEVRAGTAAAFIAAVKILQQWRAVEVWWQGAWLTQNRTAGWVFHVPLVQGDMDFTRLDFCLTSTMRDTMSYAIKLTRTCEVTRRLWNDCNFPAESCYMPSDSRVATRFISHKGMTPDPLHIASYCAYWLGFSDLQPDDEVRRLVGSATQSLATEETSAPLTEAERARINRESEKAERKRLETEAEAARRRAASVQ